MPNEILRSGIFPKPDREGLSSLDNEKLLEYYASKQRETDINIKGRDNPDRRPSVITEPNKFHGKTLSEKEIPEMYQKAIEQNFRDLNYLREEIDRRGLQAPTMEESGM